MTLDQLRAVCAVAACGSFSRAAHNLFITQPALSMQIKALEQELDQRLFERDRRNVRQTQAGEAVLRRAHLLLAEAQGITQDLADLRGLVAGRLTIACSDTVGRYLLLPRLARFVKRYSAVQITVRNTTSDEACRLVAAGEADVGLASVQGRQARLACAPWRTYRDVALCRPAHALAKRSSVSLRELAQERLLLLERGTASREAIEVAFRGLGLQLVSVMEAGSVETQKDFAAIGLGVAIVPDFASKAPAAALKALAIREATARSIDVVTRQGRALPAAAKAFVEALGCSGSTPSA